jgi:hypothetical protein
VDGIRRPGNELGNELGISFNITEVCLYMIKIFEVVLYKTSLYDKDI